MFDNLKDVRQKFDKTYVYYMGKPFWVSTIDEVNHGEFEMSLYGPRPGPKGTKRGGPDKVINPADGNLQYREYHIGYLQSLDYAMCPWLCRTPFRQYRQGLHMQSQVRVDERSAQVIAADMLVFDRKMAEMLENVYPDLHTAMKATQDNPGETTTAMHKDFALTFNRLHKDFFIDYRARRVGALSHDCKPTFYPETEHLKERFNEEVLKLA